MGLKDKIRKAAATVMLSTSKLDKQLGSNNEQQSDNKNVKEVNQQDLFDDLAQGLETQRVIEYREMMYDTFRTHDRLQLDDEFRHTMNKYAYQEAVKINDEIDYLISTLNPEKENEQKRIQSLKEKKFELKEMDDYSLIKFNTENKQNYLNKFDLFKTKELILTKDNKNNINVIRKNEIEFLTNDNKIEKHLKKIILYKIKNYKNKYEVHLELTNAYNSKTDDYDLKKPTSKIQFDHFINIEKIDFFNDYTNKIELYDFKFLKLHKKTKYNRLIFNCKTK